MTHYLAPTTPLQVIIFPIIYFTKPKLASMLICESVWKREWPVHLYVYLYANPVYLVGNRSNLSPGKQTAITHSADVSTNCSYLWYEPNIVNTCLSYTNDWHPWFRITEYFLYFNPYLCLINVVAHHWVPSTSISILLHLRGRDGSVRRTGI